MTECETTKLLAQKYREEGYEVTKEPNPNLIPFDLGGYRPDLLATKDNSNLIIEVKAKATAKFSIERFQRIAQEIAKHQGWRFILVTANDEQENEEIDAEKSYLTWDEINQQIAQFPSMIRIIGNNAALLYLWGICEAALRRYALDHAIPVERKPFTPLAKYLYSEGELSIEELNMLLDVQKYRNKVAHGFKVNVNDELLDNLTSFVKKIITQHYIIAYHSRE
jgi:hypothetical protein